MSDWASIQQIGRHSAVTSQLRQIGRVYCRRQQTHFAPSLSHYFIWLSNAVIRRNKRYDDLNVLGRITGQLAKTSFDKFVT